MQSRRREEFQIVFRHPNRHAMLKCAMASSRLDSPSRASSSIDSSPRRPMSALSPTLSDLVSLLQKLEQRDPLTLAAVARYVAQELGSRDEASQRLPFDSPSEPPWGWRGRVPSH